MLAGADRLGRLASDVREAFRRTCVAFAGAALLSPVAAVVFVVTEPNAADPIFPKAAIFLACLVVGLVLATMGWLSAKYVPRLGDTWFGAIVGAGCALILAIVIFFSVPWLLS